MFPIFKVYLNLRSKLSSHSFQQLSFDPVLMPRIQYRRIEKISSRRNARRCPRVSRQWRQRAVEEPLQGTGGQGPAPGFPPGYQASGWWRGQQRLQDDNVTAHFPRPTFPQAAFNVDDQLAGPSTILPSPLHSLEPDLPRRENNPNSIATSPALESENASYSGSPSGDDSSTQQPSRSNTPSPRHASSRDVIGPTEGCTEDASHESPRGMAICKFFASGNCRYGST